MKLFIFYDSDSAEKNLELSEERSIESARVLGAGAKANLRDKNGKPALKNAKSGNWKKVKRGRFEPNAGMSARNKEQRTKLRSAAKYGDLESGKRLLAEGVDVDETSENGMTVLQLAALNGHNEVMKRLIEAEANMSAEDDSSRTPLMRAAAEGRLAVIKNLLDAGDDVDRVSVNGTALMRVAQAQRV